jgi:hypothetical protein
VLVVWHGGGSGAVAGATSRLAYQQVSDAGDTGISHEPHTPTPLLIDFTTETDTTLNALGAGVDGGVRVSIGWRRTRSGDAPVSVTISLLDTDTSGTRSRTRELNGKILRSLNFGTLIRSVRRSRYTPPTTTVERVEIPRHQGSQTTVEMLAYIASLYREAYALGVPIQAYIAQETGRPLSTASKLIMRARKQGLLGHAVTGRPGETDL